MFHDHLDCSGHEAGRSEDDEEPTSQEPAHRPAPERDQRGRRHGQDDQGVGRRVREVHPERSVFKYQRMRPNGLLKVAGDRFELGEPVRPR